MYVNCLYISRRLSISIVDRIEYSKTLCNKINFISEESPRHVQEPPYISFGMTHLHHLRDVAAVLGLYLSPLSPR